LSERDEFSFVGWSGDSHGFEPGFRDITNTDSELRPCSLPPDCTSAFGLTRNPTMNPVYYPPLSRIFVRVCLLAAGILFASRVSAQVAGTGTIEGRVFDQRRGEYLEKARIRVEGTAQEVLTDSAGTYRLTNVPAGTVRFSVFYTGLGTQNEIVTVSAGQTVQHDVTLAGVAGAKPSAAAAGDTIKMGEFVVSSSKEMEGAALAINEQRFARNITNVVSADEFGTIADGSVGEFMKFLPGITSDYTGGDARRFSINGVPAGNVPI
jgi:iron complex outermembrane recepter protein